MTIRKEKKIYRTAIGKEVKLSLLVDDMILIHKNLKETARKLLEFLNKSGKISGYTINMQKYLAFLYTKPKDQGGLSRWQKNKTWRSSFSQQMHQKHNRMWNSSYRMPTECWQRTLDFQKGKIIST